MKTRLASEFFGTAFLLMIVAGSGIMGENLAQGNAAIALLANPRLLCGAPELLQSFFVAVLRLFGHSQELFHPSIALFGEHGLFYRAPKLPC